MSQGVVRVSLADLVRDVAADDAEKAAAAMKILAEGVFADARAKMAAASAGAIAATAAAMDRHAASPSVQAYGCKILRSIVFKMPQHRVQVRADGGITALIQCLARNMADRHVTHEAVWALAAVCMNNDESILEAVAGGVRQEVQRAQEAHKEDEQIAQKCMFLAALFQLETETEMVEVTVDASTGSQVESSPESETKATES